MPKFETNLSIVIRRIADALEDLSADELKKLSDPQYSLEIRAFKRRLRDDATLIPDAVVTAETVMELTNLPTRQDAQVLLDARYPTRKALEFIARYLDIPMVKQDKVEALRDKIIEATVGARIRSQAIQGVKTD